MPAVFIVDRSAKEPSPLVQRLSRAGYHTLCLADCHTALETLRCVRPELMIVDVAAMGVHAGLGILTALGREGNGRPVVPVMIVGAKLSDYRELAGLVNYGEIVPAVYSTPDDVADRVRRYVRPAAPPTPPSPLLPPPASRSRQSTAAGGSTIVHDGQRWGTGEGLLG